MMKKIKKNAAFLKEFWKKARTIICNKAGVRAGRLFIE